MSFPSKAEREKCWTSRDVFWKCLDESTGNQDTCAKFREMYENSCPKQWVKHFDRKREYLQFKDRIQNEGNRCHSINSPETVGQLGSSDGARLIALTTPPSSSDGITFEIVDAGEGHKHDGNQSQSSTSNTTKCPSPNTRIFRKFQPPTFT